MFQLEQSVFHLWLDNSSHNISRVQFLSSSVSSIDRNTRISRNKSARISFRLGIHRDIIRQRVCDRLITSHPRDDLTCVGVQASKQSWQGTSSQPLSEKKSPQWIPRFSCESPGKCLPGTYTYAFVHFKPRVPSQHVHTSQ
jgi:hypothetical protein